MVTLRAAIRGPALTASVSALLCALLFAPLGGSTAYAAPLALSDVPVFLNNITAEPLVMLALSNDEQLYHKAYTDWDDVDGDGMIDSTYKDTINYYGYFDPGKCYAYSGAVDSGLFSPTAIAAGTNGHACNSVSGGGRWSGNFLNWAAMSRMDALRKVLYGGYRSTDTSSSTILERVYIPSDNHAWAKFYAASDLGNYTPYDIGTYTSGITMCNITPSDASNDPSETTTTTPRLRVANGQFTEWAAQESKQCLWQGESNGGSAWASNSSNPGASPTFATNGIAEFTVRVQACVSSLLGSEKCKTYGTSVKPVGLLQDFADADELKIRFGLMTGTYGKRKSGGELRKNIARFTDEVNATNGTFTGSAGIVKSINLMRISRYSYATPGYGGADSCPAAENSWVNGHCSNWGNPMGEIFLEALRYYVGKSPNSAFTSDDTPWIANLTSPSWVNPYGAASTSPTGGGGSVCAKPNILAVSTGVSSFDNDEYSSASDIPGLTTTKLNTQTDNVGNNEGVTGNQWYVGSLSGGTPNDVCTSMTVNNLSSVTGICPEAAGLQGSFKIAGLAYYAHMHSMQSVSGKATPTVDTYAVSLAPPTPSLKIPVSGSTVTVIPAGYNLRDSNAMQLINFRVIAQAADMSSGLYFMNFENAPAGSDYDNDMKGFLYYAVSGGTLKITMWESGTSAGAVQVMGYTISGVPDPGTYYLISNDSLAPGYAFPTSHWGGSRFFSSTASADDSACGAAGFSGVGTDEECHVLNYLGTGLNPYLRGMKTHSAGTSTTGLLKQPLWYASKYGGFKDISGSGVPDTTAEWDTNGDGIPDNYFFVTNPTNLESQLSNAFNAILAHAGSASSASVNSGSINSTTRVFQAKFDTSSWSGDVLAYAIAADGTLSTTPAWSAALKMPAATSRNILTPGSTGLIRFRWTSLSSAQQAMLYPSDTATMGQNRLNYLRGDHSMEQSVPGGIFRNRDSSLGDIVDSGPVYVAAPQLRYRDNLETVTYSSFKAAQASRTPIVYVGANDGMLHAFDASVDATTGLDTATAGTEKWAFIPKAVFPNLYNLPSPSYTHQYYVDGTPSVVDGFFGGAWHTVLAAGLNKGGKEIYALDVTNPAITEGSPGSGTLLWEFTSTTDADLGYTYSRPAIVRMHNGVWAAIFGNGYNSGGSGHAILFIVNLQTGAVIAKLDTKVGSTTTPNGLATPAVIDANNDGIVDYVYAGDLQGNMWKFDITSGSPSSWGVPYTDGSGNPAPLFTATDASGNAQPITERPQVGYGPSGNGFVVLFGTGKFIEASDRTVDPSNPRVQSFYGVYDANSGTGSDVVTSRSSLLQQTILYEGPVTVTLPDGTTATDNIRQVSSNTVNLATQHGWYIDLESPSAGYQAEKQVTDPTLRNGTVSFTTTIPMADVCAYGGTSWFMQMDSLSGSALQFSAFDLNGDKKFNDADMATITKADGTTMSVEASGLQSSNGILTRPGFVTGSDEEHAISADTSGILEGFGVNPGAGALGRQSWRQIR
jgi:type IV pilus assembly protein PilY1